MLFSLNSDKKVDKQNDKEGLSITEIIRMGQEINSDWLKSDTRKNTDPKDASSTRETTDK